MKRAVITVTKVLTLAVFIAANVLALAVWNVERAGAAEVRVLASGAIKTVFEELTPQYEKAAKGKLLITYGSSDGIKQEIQKGTPFDLALVSASVMDAQVKQGTVVQGTRVDVARSGAGLAVRKGAPKPDIGTVEAFKRTLLTAKAFGYSKIGMTAQFLPDLLQRLGIAEEMKPKMKLARPGQNEMDALANGEFDMCIPQISEALVSPGVDLVGPLPPEIQVYTVISAAVATGAREPEAAKEFLKFLATPEAIKVIKAKGLEPGLKQQE